MGFENVWFGGLFRGRRREGEVGSLLFDFSKQNFIISFSFYTKHLN
jgi:hypothetical protein